MKKQILELGLAGLLSVLSSNTNALEVNEKGFPVPDKSNTTLVEVETGYGEINSVTPRIYIKRDGSGFVEFLYNGKLGAYAIFPTLIYKTNDAYAIEDTNCDGTFETKEEFNKWGLAPISECYRNKK